MSGPQMFQVSDFLM